MRHYTVTCGVRWPHLPLFCISQDVSILCLTGIFPDFSPLPVGSQRPLMFAAVLRKNLLFIMKILTVPWVRTLLYNCPPSSTLAQSFLWCLLVSTTWERMCPSLALACSCMQVCLWLHAATRSLITCCPCRCTEREDRLIWDVVSADIGKKLFPDTSSMMPALKCWCSVITVHIPHSSPVGNVWVLFI